MIQFDKYFQMVGNYQLDGARRVNVYAHQFLPISFSELSTIFAVRFTHQSAFWADGYCDFDGEHRQETPCWLLLVLVFALKKHHVFLCRKKSAVKKARDNFRVQVWRRKSRQDIQESPRNLVFLKVIHHCCWFMENIDKTHHKVSNYRILQLVHAWGQRI